MSAFISNPGLSLRDSYNSLLMTPQNRMAGVYLAQPDYTVISQITDLLGAPVKVNKRKFERSRLGKLGISQQIDSRTTSGTSLILGFADVEFQQIRVGWLVRSENGALARVTSSAPGSITITPWTNADGDDASTFVAADFADAEYIAAISNSSKDSGSDIPESQKYVPTSDYNYSSVKRDACNITRDDLTEATYEMYDGKFWAFAQENLMRINFAREYENSLLVGTRNQKGGYTTTGGALWWIKRNGQYFPSTDSAITQSTVHDIIRTVKNQSGRGGGERVVLCGSKAFSDIQEAIGDKFIQYAGVNNTIGGKAVKGIDISEYAYLGVKWKFVDYPAFNDDTLFPDVSSVTGELRSSSTMMILDTSPVETTNGMVPSFEKFYKSTQPVHYFYVPGIVGVDGLDPSNALQEGYTMTANGRDEFTAGILVDDGFYMNGSERHALYELTS